MKKLIILLTAAVSINCYGQKEQETSTPKTTPVYWMFKFTTNKLLNVPNGLNQNNISLGSGVDILYDWRLGDKGFGLSPGIGFMMNSYKTNANFTTNSNGITEIQIISDTIQYKTCSLTTMYFDIPIEFRYITKPNEKNRTFGIGAGIKVGYLVYNSQVFTTESGNFKTTITEKNLPNFSPFRCALTSRISYRRLKTKYEEVVGTSLSLFASYGLSRLLERGKGPTLTSYSIGIGYAFIFK